VRNLDRGGYPTVSQMTAEAGWEDLRTAELADALRSSLRAEYADASEEELREAVENVFDAMSPAEAFNFGSALSQIGKSAGRLAADPTFQSIVRTAAPIAGGALGTYFGGPVGMALGTQLGNLAASALPPPTAPAAPPAPPPPARPPPPPPPAPPQTAPPPPTARVPPAPMPGGPSPGALPAPTAAPGAAPAPGIPSVPGPASAVAGGSAAAAQGLVLTQQPDVLKALLAASLGQHGRQSVSGIPVGQLLAMVSQVFGQAAADADALMYLDQQPDATEGIVEEIPAGSPRSLYADLLGADNLELAEAVAEGSFESAEAAGEGSFESAEAAGEGSFEFAEAAGWEGLDS
jgi:hypothetical protein